MTLLRPQPPGTPAPVPSIFSAPYWEGCALGELRFLRCANCHLALADAPRICWRCHSRELNWQVSEGRGRLYSWTIVWRPQTPEFEVPYAVAIVDLAEGCSIISAIIGCTPEELVEGMELHPNSDHLSLPYFRPVGPA
jgi:uncharacterized OB-fold protein